MGDRFRKLVRRVGLIGRLGLFLLLLLGGLLFLLDCLGLFGVEGGLLGLVVCMDLEWDTTILDATDVHSGAKDMFGLIYL